MIEQRLTFEAWFADSRRNRGAKHRPNFDTLADGTYADDHTQRHWWTWQCARACMAPLQEMLKKANDQAEHFEREWYLRGDKLESLQERADALEEALRELIPSTPQPAPEILPPINYATLYAFAERHKISYNALCSAVRSALATPQPDTVQVPREPTQDMLYAMAELDGWKRGDREHPMLTRWEDYWNAAIAVSPKESKE